MGERKVRAPKSIEVIRKRPGMFIGSTDNPDHLVHECIDNFLDELRNNYGDTAGIGFKQGLVLVFDNGRGLPLGVTKDEETGKEVDSIELIFSKLHTGSKFSISDDQSNSLFGQNGVGLTATNALSDYVDVKTTNGKEIWHYKFIDGVLKTKEQIDKIKYKTEIIFKPSKSFFESLDFTLSEFKNRLELAQAKLPNKKFIFNGKEVQKQSLETFVRKRLELEENTPLFSLNYKTKVQNKPVILEIFLTYQEGDSKIDGDCNLRFCSGSYLNNIQSLIRKLLPNKLDKKFAKSPERFLDEGLRLYCSLTYPLPSFDSQTKSRLVTSTKEIIDPIENKLNKILGEEWIINTVENILSQKLNAKITKSGRNKKISSETKLRDCTNHPGDTLFVVEGDSAEAVFRDARDAQKEATLALKIRGSKSILNLVIKPIKNG